MKELHAYIALGTDLWLQASKLFQGIAQGWRKLVQEWKLKRDLPESKPLFGYWTVLGLPTALESGVLNPVLSEEASSEVPEGTACVSHPKRSWDES